MPFRRRLLIKGLGTAACLQDPQQGLIGKAPTVQERIIDAAQRWGLNTTLMLRIADCESKFGTHPNTYNGLSGHYGVYQFSLRTWRWASASSGWYGYSPIDDEANIEIAMWLMKNVGPSQWSCK